MKNHEDENADDTNVADNVEKILGKKSWGWQGDGQCKEWGIFSKKRRVAGYIGTGNILPWYEMLLDYV